MTAAEPSGYGPTWYADTAVPAPQRPRLARDTDVEVCVIGAGLAGLTAAREIARRGWSVAVLEANRVAWNASGSNAGLVSAGFSERIETIVERVGAQRAKELWGLSTLGADYVRTTIRETGMLGTVPVDGRLDVFGVDREDDLLRRVAMLRVDFGADVEVWPTEQIREVVRTARYFQAMHWPAAFHIHPLNYALGLAVAAERAGARIFEETRALAIDAAGIRKLVDTPGGRIRTAHIVLAGGADMEAAFFPGAGTFIPLSTCMAATAPLGERLFEALRYTGGIADSRRGGDHYRIVGGDRLLWASRISTQVAAPRRLARQIEGDIRRVFPQLGAVQIERAWSGVMSYAIHKMPLIGEAQAGVWLANGFGGQGINTATMAGGLIARAIVEGDDRWRLFCPYELVRAGGSWTRAAAQILLWSDRLRNGLAEQLARRNDTRHRAAAERVARQATEANPRWRVALQRRTPRETAPAGDEETAARIARSQRAVAQLAAHVARFGKRSPQMTDHERLAVQHGELVRPSSAANGAGGEFASARGPRGIARRRRPQRM